MYKVTVKSGTHRHTDKRKYKPGESFFVKFKSEIPETMAHRFEFELVTVQRKDKVKVKDQAGQPLTGYGVIEDIPGIDKWKLENVGHSWYNVVEADTLKKVNTKKLRLDEAKELVAEKEGIIGENAEEPPEDEVE